MKKIYYESMKNHHKNTVIGQP